MDSCGKVKPISPLRFFADPGDIHDLYFVPMLRPFLGYPNVAIDRRDPNMGRLQSFYASAEKLFERVERDAAEIAVFPWDWDLAGDNPILARKARRWIRENAAAGLKTVAFSESDPETALQEAHTIVFRTSLLERNRRPHEYATPAWLLFEPDYSMETLVVRPLKQKLTVGFCGASYRNDFKEPNWLRRAFRPRSCQYERVFPQKPGLRAHIMDSLRAAPGIDTNFIERDGFAGGCLKNEKLDNDAFLVARREYMENLLGCDYALCARGAGNFSYRFYDALQLGRIPLFINTDCVLPWPEQIPWRKLCAWVELEELDRLPEILLSYHNGMAPAEFEDRQRQCRAIWEKHLSPLGFFSTLRTWLREQGHCRSAPKLDWIGVTWTQMSRPHSAALFHKWRRIRIRSGKQIVTQKTAPFGG